MLPDGLSMLWEPVDAAVAVRERFGFDDLDAVAGWTTAALAETWGVMVTGCSRMVISAHNAVVWVGTDDGPLVVKWSRTRSLFPSLAATTALLRTLAARGVPVVTPVAAVDGNDRVLLDGPAGSLSVAVLPERAGDWLDVADDDAVTAAGASLATLHDGLRADGLDLAEVPVRPGSQADRVGWWLDAGDHGLAPDASARLRALLAAAPDLDDRPQPVHNDFRAANVLTEGSEVVAILDLDDVVVDHRVTDLAKASIYLGTRFTDWRPTPDAVRRRFRAGYESVRPLSPAEDRWFEVLLLWQGLMAIPGPDDPAGWADAL